MNKICYIMVSPSGSGKSTLAKKLVQEKYIFSTDSLFYEDGEYKFDPTKLGKNHVKNYILFKKALEDGKSVCCDNTNLRIRDINKYKDLAEKEGYTVVYKTGCHPAWHAYINEESFVLDDTGGGDGLSTILNKEDIAQILYEDNNHGVPLEVIEKMIDNFWKVWDKINKK